MATRRPIKARDSHWAIATAAFLARLGVRPNVISIASTFMACAAGANLLDAPQANTEIGRISFYLLAAAFVQLRLLCNLFDGMVAVEGGMKSKSGEIWNELPDRISDAVILISAGYSIPAARMHGVEIGYAAAVLAVITAYVRTLGVSAGSQAYFTGPMAKQQRMAIITLACLVSIVEPRAWTPGWAMTAALAVICVGCAGTIINRTVRIVRELESR